MPTRAAPQLDSGQVNTNSQAVILSRANLTDGLPGAQACVSLGRKYVPAAPGRRA